MRCEHEDDGSEFGDVRLTARAKRMVDALSGRPGDSFPDVFRDDADLEAAYRFVNNSRVTLPRLMEPHVRATVGRAAKEMTVVVAHDTTSFRYEGDGRRGLGRLLQKGRGFYAHVALAVSRNEDRDPLGVVGLRTIVRKEERTDKAKDKNAKVRRDDRESLRWAELVEEVGARCKGGVEAIHVMDREADSFELFERLLAGGHRFVIRLTHDRRLDGTGKLVETLKGASVVATRQVQLSGRVGHSAPSTRKIHPPREERGAALSVSATRVAFKNPRAGGASVELNVVRVVELEPPTGEEPIEWRLATTEPIDTAEQVLAIVDAYRARWRIEEFFKALKTGCAIEKRQLESLHALLNALGLFVPIAWTLLRLRVLARHDRPACEVLTTTQIHVLRASTKNPLPPHFSVRNALLAIAKLGGHLKHNGDPGWLVLGRGYEELLALERGWLLANAAKSGRTYDQS